MKLPLIIKKKLSVKENALWEYFYKSPAAAFNRTIEEGLWRRTQHRGSSIESGWKNEDDARRRIIHYEHRFDTVKNSDGTTDLALFDTYLWLHLTLPSQEIVEWHSVLTAALRKSGWKNDSADDHTYIKEDLHLHLKIKEHEEQDQIAARQLPKDYKVLEICASNKGNQKALDFKQKPWSVLKTGIRKKDLRGNPTTDNAADEIARHLPAQVELGCGASIEAGIPPLHFLHEVYSVTEKSTGDFIFDLRKDNLITSIIKSPEKTYRRFSEMYRKCFEAKPTKFHLLLKKMHDAGYFVGPVITNNFDGLAEKSGLAETYVRRYDENHIVPHIDFNKKARSLLVVGAHADRRKIEQAARNQGLKVMFLDPEGYYNQDGRFTSYPLEGPQNSDILYRETATKGLVEIAKRLDFRDNQKKKKSPAQTQKRK